MLNSEKKIDLEGRGEDEMLDVDKLLANIDAFGNNIKLRSHEKNKLQEDKLIKLNKHVEEIQEILKIEEDNKRVRFIDINKALHDGIEQVKFQVSEMQNLSRKEVEKKYAEDLETIENMKNNMTSFQEQLSVTLEETSLNLRRDIKLFSENIEKNQVESSETFGHLESRIVQLEQTTNKWMINESNIRENLYEAIKQSVLDHSEARKSMLIRFREEIKQKVKEMENKLSTEIEEREQGHNELLNLLNVYIAKVQQSLATIVN